MLFKLPLFKKLEDSESVLVAGCGGGYDIFCGLPIYFALQSLGKTVHLSNLTFSGLDAATAGAHLTESLVKVTAETSQVDDYFPEKHLCRWFRAQGRDVPIYCFEKTGIVPMAESYRVLRDELSFDSIVVVDGGTDSLMRGDEAGLGTPVEDLSTIASVKELDGMAVKLLACLGFGIDAYHGVCHAHFLEAVAELARSRAFHGAFSVLEEMPEFRLYREAAEFVFAAMPRPSIVNASVLSAVEGEYGDVHRVYRTAGSTLWINPLMGLYWIFDLEAVAARVLYLEALEPTQNLDDVARAIQGFRLGLKKIRARQIIPV